MSAFSLLAFVRIEPAPVDLAFLLLIVVVALRSAQRSAATTAGRVCSHCCSLSPVTILSLVNANDWGAALKFEAITLYLLAFAMFLPHDAPTFGVLRPAIKAYIIVAAFSALLGMLAIKPGFPGSSALMYDTQRTQAFFKDPNVFGPFLVPALIIVLEDLVRPRLLGWSTRRCGLVALILALGVLFSYSRAAILNFGLGAVTLFGVYLWRRRGRAAALKLGRRGCPLRRRRHSASSRATNSLTFFESRSHLQSYDHNRFATQGAGFQQASVHLFGHGPGQVQVNLPLATHSVYARVAYEQGYIGLALIIAIFLGDACDARSDSPSATETSRVSGRRLTRRLGGIDCEQLLHRHPALASSLDRRGADLVRRDYAEAGGASRRGRARIAASG